MLFVAAASPDIRSPSQTRVTTRQVLLEVFLFLSLDTILANSIIAQKTTGWYGGSLYLFDAKVMQLYHTIDIESTIRPKIPQLAWGILGLISRQIS